MTETIGSHVGIAVAGAFIDQFGSGPLLIRRGRRSWFFEFSDMFGPTLLRKSDFEPSDRQPVKESDPFWEPFHAWMRSGKKCRQIRDRRGRVQFALCHAPRKEKLR